MKQVVKESVERIEDKLQSISESFDKAMGQVFGVELTEKKSAKVKEDAKPEALDDEDKPSKVKEDAKPKSLKDGDKPSKKGEKLEEKEESDEEKTDVEDDEKDEKKGKKEDKDEDDKDDEKDEKKGKKEDKDEDDEDEKEEKDEKKVSEGSKGKKKTMKENLVSSGDAKGADVFKTGDGKGLSDSGLSKLSKGEEKKKPKGKAGYEDVKGPSGETYDKVYTDNKSKDNETVPGEEGNKGVPVKEGFFKTQKMDRASMKQKVLLTKYTKDDEGHDTSDGEGFGKEKESGETYDKSAKDNTKKSDEGPRDEKGSLKTDSDMGFKEKPKFGDALKSKKSKNPSKSPSTEGKSGSVGEKESGEASGTEFYKK